MNFENILREDHGKEVLIITKDNHHYQGQLVGCQCKDDSFECSHLIILLLFNNNYVIVEVENIIDIKIIDKKSKSFELI